MIKLRINTKLMRAATMLLLMLLTTTTAWADSETITVSNWAGLKNAISDGAKIELSGDDVYYAVESGITINSGTVTIYGKGHTIDAAELNAHIFEVGNGATLILKNMTLKNTVNNGDGGAIYNNQSTLTITGCTFTNNEAKSEKGGAIYNHQGILKIVDSKFDKNAKYDRAIYNYAADEDNLFKLTILNTEMVQDKVCVNYNDCERRLDDKGDLDLLTTEYNANIPEIIYDGTAVPITITTDTEFTGTMVVAITNAINNPEVSVNNGEGSTTYKI